MYIKASGVARLLMFFAAMAYRVGVGAEVAVAGTMQAPNRSAAAATPVSNDSADGAAATLCPSKMRTQTHASGCLRLKSSIHSPQTTLDTGIGPDYRAPHRTNRTTHHCPTQMCSFVLVPSHLPFETTKPQHIIPAPHYTLDAQRHPLRCQPRLRHPAQGRVAVVMAMAPHDFDRPLLQRENTKQTLVCKCG
jgi:hypothetical protein